MYLSKFFVIFDRVTDSIHDLNSFLDEKKAIIDKISTKLKEVFQARTQTQSLVLDKRSPGKFSLKHKDSLWQSQALHTSGDARLCSGIKEWSTDTDSLAEAPEEDVETDLGEPTVYKHQSAGVPRFGGYMNELTEDSRQMETMASDTDFYGDSTLGKSREDSNMDEIDCEVFKNLSVRRFHREANGICLMACKSEQSFMVLQQGFGVSLIENGRPLYSCQQSSSKLIDS